LDLLIGLISESDKLHIISKRIFELINSNELRNVYIPSSALLEYELTLKSKGIKDYEILKDIAHFKNIENINELPLNSSIIISAIKLREKYFLTYFDSLHAAGALYFDGVIIGTDEDYSKINELEIINPKTLI
jgi:predicted nucleic acid-binding protein